MSATTFTGTPDAQGNFIQAADIAELVALAAIYTRTEILDALTSATISPAECRDLPRPRPEQLVPGAAPALPPARAADSGVAAAGADDVPDQLRRRATPSTGRGVGRRRSSRSRSAIQLHEAYVKFDGTFNVDLTIHPNNTVNGTVSVSGTVQLTPAS